jgi:periplasmic copper chaperone A
MRPAPVPLQIPGHSELQMKPGGVHLMIADARTELEPGDTVNLSVRLKDGRVLDAEAELIPFGGRPTDHHHGASHE